MKLSNAILRAVPGAFILNAGLGKLGMDKETAAGMQEMAANGVPAVKNMTPEEFGKFLSWGEVAVGSALLLPFVPTRVTGLGLAAFSAGMLANYFAIPGMTQEDGIRPSQDGTALAKDSWLAAIAAALILNGSAKKNKN